MKRKAVYSSELGIDLRSRKGTELFKWFLACLLFGKPIQQAVARRTYDEFVKEGLLTPESILAAGWDKLVQVLDRGHYVRYDFSTATKLLEVWAELRKKCLRSPSSEVVWNLPAIQMVLEHHVGGPDGTRAPNQTATASAPGSTCPRARTPR